MYSHLLPITAFLCLGAFAHGAIRDEVVEKNESFLNAGHRISVETFSPKKPGNYPGVLVLHSSAGTLFGKRQLEHFSRLLAARGMVAFMVRYFDRTGTIFAGDGTIGKDLHLWEGTVIDALDFVAAHPGVKHDSIGIFGYSLGAFLAVSVASKDSRVDAVAELSGGMFDYLGNHLDRVPPTLILHGTADERVNIRYAHALEREIRRHGVSPLVHLYPGEGHVMSDPAIADASARAVQFLGTHLHAFKAH